jgi:hypothetical protein
MKLGNVIAILAILGATSLFAGDVNSVSDLVDRINNTNDLREKNDLMDDLEYELETIDEKDLPKAQEIVNKKLIVSKVLQN